MEKFIIDQGWRRAQEVWGERELGLLILNSWSINIQLLTNCGASNKLSYYVSYFNQS